MIEKPLKTEITCGDICWLSSYIYIDERFWVLQGTEG